MKAPVKPKKRPASWRKVPAWKKAKPDPAKVEKAEAVRGKVMY